MRARKTCPKDKKEKRNGSVCYLCSKRGMCATIGYNTISQHRPVIPKVNAQMIFFYGSKPKRSSSCVVAQNTHSVCRETSWHACSGADKHMVDITERLLSRGNQWTGGLGGLAVFFFLFFFCGYPRLRRCRNTGITGCNATPSSTLEKSTVTASLVLGQKRVKGKQKKKDRWENQSLQIKKNKQINRTKHIKWTENSLRGNLLVEQTSRDIQIVDMTW